MDRLVAVTGLDGTDNESIFPERRSTGEPFVKMRAPADAMAERGIPALGAT